MKILSIIFATVLAAQAPGTTPAQPFPNHEKPPEGWFCRPSMNEKELSTDVHACACRGMVLDDPEPFCKRTPEIDDEGNPLPGEGYLTESSKCKVYCHKDHCRCSLKCKDS